MNGGDAGGAPAGRRRDIQGLRALAVLLVVIFHAGLPLPGGFAGVDVFFVISGFVITGLLMAELQAHQRVDLRAFYLRRFRRLLPPLALTSSVVAVVAIGANPIGTQVTTAFTGIFASLFSANAYLYRSAPGYFSPGAEFNPMLHTWSLSVEEQFYFVFPVMMAFAWRLAGADAAARLRRRGVAALILGILVLSFGLGCAMSFGRPLLPGISAPAQFAFYASPTRAWEFAAGALLALSPAGLARVPVALAAALSGAGLLLLAGCALMLDGSVPFPGWVAWVPVGATVLLIVGGGAGAHPISRLLSSRAAVWIGDRSYGWYLWHWPFVVFTRAVLPDAPTALVVASALSLVPAWASYRYVEMPIRAVRQPSPRATLQLTALCIAIPILLFGGLLLANRAIVGSPGAAHIDAGLQLHVDEVRHCEGLRPAPAGAPDGCTWRVPDARGTVLLLGDSNAGHFTEAVAQAANAAGLDATVATQAACPFLDLRVYSNGLPNERCEAFVAATLAAIERQPPSLVILASASDGYIEESATSLQGRDGGPRAVSPDEKARLWTQGLSAVLARLSRRAPVLVVHPVPRFRTWNLSACAAYKVALNPMACGTDAPRSALEAWRRRAVVSEQAAVAAAPDTVALELIDELCPTARCAVARDGTWIFRDGAHLSVPGALSLAGAFREAIERHARR